MSKSKKRKELESEDELLEPPVKKIKGKVIKKSDNSYTNTWRTHELVSEIEGLDLQLSQTICQLFDEDFTIPFLCRYRKDLIQDLPPLRLREIKDTIDNVKTIEMKSVNLMKSLEKEKLLTDEISKNIRAVKSLEELDHMSQMYKPPSKGSLYERAQKLGLEPTAEDLLYGRRNVDLMRLVKPEATGLKTLKEVEDGVKNIMSQLIAKNEGVMNEIRELRSRFGVTITTSKVKSKEKEDKKDSQKFENYYNFTCSADRIRPHQILAINRGESLKAISVKLEVDERFQHRLKEFVVRNFLKNGIDSPTRQKVFSEAFTDAYKKKISAFIVRQTSSELKRRGEKASVDSFAENLKNLLLQKPVKGVRILGIDPGFTSGCKLAVISETGEVLKTNKVIFPTFPDRVKEAENIVGELLQSFNCSLIAIGNATACRETENFISKLIEKRFQTCRYVIVSEQGASIYSCSDLAKKEFPKLDVSFIGAISIARRLLDPLSELVKIEPKHLGVGMYQHDINEKTLQKSLDEIVSECVSFVGVDVNIASVSLLKHVAGLTEKRAEAIVKYREEVGSFKSREELSKVKSIGPKTFTQCAGFVRINGLSAGLKKFNLLDATNVHPESYETAKDVIKECGLKLENIGAEQFVRKIQKYRDGLEDFSKFKENSERVKTTLEALSQQLFHDYRNEVKIEPVFKQGIVDISTLSANKIVTGVVMNLTDFGAFVDLGVGKNGLIHISAMRNSKLKVSDKVECKVLNVDKARGRIGLEFVKMVAE